MRASSTTSRIAWTIAHTGTFWTVVALEQFTTAWANARHEETDHGAGS